jgi:hypothetical protein
VGLELAEVVMNIEEEFDLTLPGEAPVAWNMATVGELIDYTRAQYRKLQQPPQASTVDDVDFENRMIAILAEQTGRPSAAIRREHRLLADLGL